MLYFSAFDLFCWQDVADFAVFAFSQKLHNAVAFCKERIVASHTNVFARMHFSASLTHDNTPRAHDLTAERLYP